MADALMIVRAAYFASVLQLFGLLVFGAVFSGWDNALPRSRRIWRFLAVLVLGAMSVRLVVVSAAMSGMGVGRAVSQGTLGIVLAETRFGHLWLARACLLLGVCIVSYMGIRGTRLVVIVALTLVLALTAASGHAGATPGPGGAVHLAADTLHLCAAGVWIGGLLPLAQKLKSPDSLEQAYRTARRFSVLGSLCVGAILVSGSINTWFLVGSLPALVETEYGHVLLIKLAVFASLLSIACLNRFSLTPRMQNGATQALTALRRNVLLEALLGLAIIVIVGKLGMLPPAHEIWTVRR